mgnify:CR=1 FL=1
MVGQRHRLLLVMGDMNEGGADALLDGLRVVLHLAPELEIERAERLVEQQHGRFDHQSAGQRHALPLAAGKLMRLLVEQCPRGRPAPSAACAALTAQLPVDAMRIIRPKPTLLPTRHMRKQRIILEHRRGRPFAPAASGVQSAPLISTLPCSRNDETAEDRQQRGLARAGGTEQHRVAAPGAIVERRHRSAPSPAEAVVNVVDLDQRHRSCPPLRKQHQLDSTMANTIGDGRRPASRRHWSWD